MLALIVILVRCVVERLVSGLLPLQVLVYDTTCYRLLYLHPLVALLYDLSSVQ